ncbi:hypothetical protein ABDK96_02450 [Citricoccus nitrophenolicus]|uniref:Uncharacterized protein n=1 Tax=Citricoccus nitrophenolicus TaxID=863575 RepID=A0ABV0IEE4_9MICC
MRKSRVRGVLPALGLLLMAASVPLFALDAPRPASVLLACGLLGVATSLVWTARSSHRALTTLSSNLGRARRQQLAADEAWRGGMERLLQTSLEPVQDGLRTLAGEVDGLRDVPALRAWQGLHGRRREGVSCLLMGGRDAESILGADDSGASFEVVDLEPGTPAEALLPSAAPHAVGAVLIDVDLFDLAPMDREAWTGFVRWLRADVPVVGFSRVPGRLALRAATVSRTASGLLLPTVTGPHTVTFERGIEPNGGDRP